MHTKEKRIQDEELLKTVRLMGCCVCGSRPVDASHIKTRGSGGDDTKYNVVPHCRKCHIEWHQYGAKKFCDKYPIMLIKLKNLGWCFDVNQKLFRVSDFFSGK